MTDIDADARHEAVDLLRHLQKRHRTEKPYKDIARHGFFACSINLGQHLVLSNCMSGCAEKQQQAKREKQHRPDDIVLLNLH